MCVCVVMTGVISGPVRWQVGVRPLRLEGCAVSSGDGPEPRPLRSWDYIGIEETKSYQTSQWRERSPSSQSWRKRKEKGKKKANEQNSGHSDNLQQTHGTRVRGNCDRLGREAEELYSLMWDWGSVLSSDFNAGAPNMSIGSSVLMLKIK